MALPATDNFNRADNGSLGANWTMIEGDFDIFNNGVSANGVESAAYWNADTFPNDQYCQATNVAAGNHGVTVRSGGSSTATRFGYEINSHSSLTDFVTKRTSGGGYTVLGNLSAEYGAGDIMKLEIVGTTLTAYRNGTQVGQWTDSALASGSAGLQSYGNLLSTVDDWEAGATGAGVGYQRWGLEDDSGDWNLEASVDDHWITEASSGTEPNIGSLAGTSAGPQGAASGTQSQTGTVAGTAKGNGAITGTQSQTGTVEGTAKGNGAIGGTQSQVGTVVGTARGDGAIVGTESQTGTIAGTAKGNGVVNGTQSQVGTVAGTAGGPQGDFTGETAQSGDITGVVAGTSGGPAAAGVGTQAQTATVAGTSVGPRGALDGTQLLVGAITGRAGGPGSAIFPPLEGASGSAGGPSGAIVGTQSIMGIIIGGACDCDDEVEILVTLLKLARLSENEPRTMRVAIEEIVDKLNELIRQLNPNLT